MKHDISRILLGVLLGFIITAVLLGTITKAVVPGICIYEVSMNLDQSHAVIGWTPTPCQDLDIRNKEDYNRLMHSDFTIACPIFSIQTWPEIYLPVVSYAQICGFTYPPLDGRSADDILNR